MESRIELSGFGDIDSSSMEIVKKNVLNHFRKIESITKNMQKTAWSQYLVKNTKIL